MLLLQRIIKIYFIMVNMRNIVQTLIMNMTVKMKVTAIVVAALTQEEALINVTNVKKKKVN